MKDVKQAILDHIEYAKMGIAECEKKLKGIEQIKIDLSRHRNEIVKLEAALRALGGTHNAPDEKPSSAKALAPSDLPQTGMDFFESCCDSEPRTFADLYFVVVAKMDLEKPTELQQRLIKQRLSNALVVLTKAKRLIQEGERGSMTYHRAVDSSKE